MHPSGSAAQHAERAHYGLPAVGSHIRALVRFTDIRGREQQFACTCTWTDATPDERTQFWQHVLRGIEQGGLKVIEITRYTEAPLEL